MNTLIQRNKIDCDNCQLRKNGMCSQLKNNPCEDFKAIPYISEEEKENWPTIMDATAFRFSSHRSGR